MLNINSFTKVLTIYCLTVFIYIVMPDAYPQIKSFLTYTIIIYTIVLLMIYNQNLSSQNLNFSKIPIDSNISDPQSYNHFSENIKNDFKTLTSLIVNMAKTVNDHCQSAIFIIDPASQSFILQSGESSEFKESISIRNSDIYKYINNKKKLHQKDNPKTWDELFYNQSWRGSECALFSSILIENSIAGFIISKIDHFTDLREKEIKIHDRLGEFISLSLRNLDSLEKHASGEDIKSFILDILSNLDFKSDSQNIYNKFKYLLLTLFDYDRLTISLRKEIENRRKYDKGLNLVIMLTDGIKAFLNKSKPDWQNDIP